MRLRESDLDARPAAQIIQPQVIVSNNHQNLVAFGGNHY